MLAIIIILLLVLIVILLMMPKQQEPAAVYVIGSAPSLTESQTLRGSRNFDDTVWPASYWNWYGGARGWGSKPEHRWTAGPGYKPAGNYGPRYIDRHRPSH